MPHTKIYSKFDSVEETFSVLAMVQIRTKVCVLRNGTFLRIELVVITLHLSVCYADISELSCTYITTGLVEMCYECMV
jgi:hypothetical protein